VGERLARDGLALLLWLVVFLVVGTVLGIATTVVLAESIVGSDLIARTVTVLVAALAGIAGTLAGRRSPAPDDLRPGPRYVLLTGPLLLVVLSVVTGPAWDAALGGGIATVVTGLLLASDRSSR
jgi:hypothetical protein